MSSTFSSLLGARLKSLDLTAQRRTLRPRCGIDFSSNDYLGFSEDPELMRRIANRCGQPNGASASRLLRGQLPIFDEAESALAQFGSRESALIFPSGYQANVALLSSILTPNDVVFSDRSNHASIIDGIRLSGARKVIYPHLDLTALKSQLEATPVARPSALRVIVTESLFGMDGDLAPLCEIVELAEQFGAAVIVDEAHATGLWGDTSSDSRGGGGRVQALGLSSRVLATVHTGGKSLGVGGAWVSGGALLKDYLINFARPAIFSTAPPPFLAVHLQESVKYWSEVGPERARSVLERANHFRKLLDLRQGAGPVVPLIVGDNARALALATELQHQGFDVRAIRPPTVPEGTARLRVCLHWGQSVREIEDLARAIIQELGGK